jgi:hypothetical protein
LRIRTAVYFLLVDRGFFLFLPLIYLLYQSMHYL